jgi:exopolysaccharide biosynthesis WecB/TagA/CpsF family protein
MRLEPQTGRRGSTAPVSGERLNVCFANAHSLTIANENERFRAARRPFSLNDGLGVDIASRIKFGKAFAANLNGTDFVPDFLAMTRHRLRVYLVGTADAAIKIAAAKLAANYRRHKIVGCRNGFFTGPEDVEETCRKIRAAKADCVLVGMGNPLAGALDRRAWRQDGRQAAVRSGALFDFKAARAPRSGMDAICAVSGSIGCCRSRAGSPPLPGDNFIFLSKVLPMASASSRRTRRRTLPCRLVARPLKDRARRQAVAMGRGAAGRGGPGEAGPGQPGLRAAQERAPSLKRAAARR